MTDANAVTETPKEEKTDNRLPDDRRWGEHFTLPIHTRIGRSLVEGRPPYVDDDGNQRPPIIGLFMHESMARPVWDQALADDPWAAWYLQLFRKELERARNSLETSFNYMREHLQELGFDIQTFPMPVDVKEYEVKVRTPTAVASASLIDDIDLYASACLFLRDQQMMSWDTFAQERRTISRIGRRVMATFASYRDCQVTRENVRGNDIAAQDATQVMGELPREILELPTGEAWTGPLVV
ncbi:AcaB family transcriptional regulator [Thioalkalivibrio sp. ALE19]|uniref:AcaB family transcriptional regulator n=1 Tax=Thioalkalivibrio sp. ALE19 TaxID=1266909 RepID=UPI00040BBAD3|nr:AcaB family transcriptional regulator [Thioalkalivibrio sp. ALE19]